jgi:prevent-host-death family protein
MNTIKASELPRKAAEVLQAVRTGGTVVITHYGKPIAQITPYKETTMYTVEIQATDDGEIWQTMDPTPETISEAVAAEMGYADAADVARDTARHQDLAEGDGWRVRVWSGEEPDLGAEPDGECYWHEVEAEFKR